MAAPRYAMHPLDAESLDGFDIVASADVVLRAGHDTVWQRLAVDADETLSAPSGETHDIVQTFGPGEHRCTTTMTVAGRTVCVRGLRRLLAHHEVIELRHFVDHDELVRTTFSPARFGRTRMVVDVAVRATARRGPAHPLTRPADRCLAARRRLGSR